jgi:uroporphyrinogen-III synthase
VIGVVLVTLSEGSLAGLEAELAARDMQVRRVPLLTFAPPPSFQPLDVALAQLGHYRAVAVTSPRAAWVLAERMAAHGAGLSSVPLWTVGERTAAPLRERFREVHVVGAPPGAGAAETLAAEMLASGHEGPVLFPGGDLRREALGRLLGDAGVRVDEVCCYRTVVADDAATVHAALEGADVAVVGSPSVGEVLARHTVAGSRPALIAIGATTATAARDAGWPPDLTSDRPTAVSIAEACRTILTTGHAS